MPSPSTLHRYWFPVPGHIGIGVTAASRIEAEALASDAAGRLNWPFDAASCMEEIDVRMLDQQHVIPNMGPPNVLGVWYPSLNL